MSRIFVAGLINIETTLRIDSFPIPYQTARYPFFGVNSTVSGVGYNIAKALLTLGDEVSFFSLVGRDFAGDLVRSTLKSEGIDQESVLPLIHTTPQSVILYDSQGKRAINTDLKDIQETVYPLDFVPQALNSCDLAAICNINFARPMLEIAIQAGKRIATDVHALGDINDPYNQDYMKSANILFISSDNLWDKPEVVADQLVKRFRNEIIVIGLGAEGSFLKVKGQNAFTCPAVFTRPIISTIGAGDALFSCFLHEYLAHDDPFLALTKASVFSSFKIGTAGAAEGLLCQAELDNWYKKIFLDKWI